MAYQREEGAFCRWKRPRQKWITPGACLLPAPGRVLLIRLFPPAAAGRRGILRGIILVPLPGGRHPRPVEKSAGDLKNKLKSPGTAS